MSRCEIFFMRARTRVCVNYTRVTSRHVLEGRRRLMSIHERRVVTNLAAVMPSRR